MSQCPTLTRGFGVWEFLRAGDGSHSPNFLNPRVGVLQRIGSRIPELNVEPAVRPSWYLNQPPRPTQPEHPPVSRLLWRRFSVTAALLGNK